MIKNEEAENAAMYLVAKGLYEEAKIIRGLLADCESVKEQNRSLRKALEWVSKNGGFAHPHNTASIARAALKENQEDNSPSFYATDTELQPVRTLRDWFAGQALAGWAANPDVRINPATTPEAAYELADAMIIARNMIND